MCRKREEGRGRRRKGRERNASRVRVGGLKLENRWRSKTK